MDTFTVDEMVAEYTIACKSLSLTDLYREQDRIMRAIPRLNVMRPPPMKMLRLLELKLEALENLVNERNVRITQLTP